MNPLALVITTIFYVLIGILGIYSIVMMYILVSYGRSKILSLVIAALYLVLMMSLYGTAAQNFHSIPVDDLSLPLPSYEL